MNDSLSEHVCRFKSNVQSLQGRLASCKTSVSSAENSVPTKSKDDITKEQIEYFAWENLAQLLHISLSRLRRRRRALLISDNFEQYSNISDDELDEICKEITAVDTNASSGGFLTPNIGRRRFIGGLGFLCQIVF